jgi:hypothetical protein
MEEAERHRYNPVLGEDHTCQQSRSDVKQREQRAAGDPRAPALGERPGATVSLPWSAVKNPRFRLPVS